MHAGKGGGWHGLPLAGRDGAGFESSFTHRMAQAVAVCGDRVFLAVLELGPRASFPRWPGKGAPRGFALPCARGRHISWRAVAGIQGDRLPRPGGTVPTSSQLKKKLRRKLIALSPALTGADSRVGGTLCRWSWAGRGGRGAGDALRGRMQPAEALRRVRDSAERKPRHRAKRGLRFHGGIRALSRKVISGFSASDASTCLCFPVPSQNPWEAPGAGRAERGGRGEGLQMAPWLERAPGSTRLPGGLRRPRLGTATILHLVPMTNHTADHAEHPPWGGPHAGTRVWPAAPAPGHLARDLAGSWGPRCFYEALNGGGREPRSPPLPRADIYWGFTRLSAPLCVRDSRSWNVLP